MVAICCARPRPRDLAGPFCAHGASPGHSGRDRPDHRSLPQLIACTGLASAAPIRNTGGDAASDALPRLLRSPRRTRPTRRPAPATLALGPQPGLQASRRLALAVERPCPRGLAGPRARRSVGTDTHPRSLDRGDQARRRGAWWRSPASPPQDASPTC